MPQLLWRQAGIDREDCPGSARATIVCGSVYNTVRRLKQEVGSSPIGAAAESECLPQRARWSDRVHRSPGLSVGISDPQVAVGGTALVVYMTFPWRSWPAGTLCALLEKALGVLHNPQGFSRVKFP
jgi:hypothetical protein